MALGTVGVLVVRVSGKGGAFRIRCILAYGTRPCSRFRPFIWPSLGGDVGVEVGGAVSIERSSALRRRRSRVRRSSCGICRGSSRRAWHCATYAGGKKVVNGSAAYLEYVKVNTDDADWVCYAEGQVG